MTSKGNLLVHLGAPKTGTTSIQTKLDSETFNLAQHGWIYPKYGRSKQVPAAHHNLAYECDGKLTTKSRFDPVPRRSRVVGASWFLNLKVRFMYLFRFIIMQFTEFLTCSRTINK